MRLELRVGGGRAIGGREQTGATAATGGALWEASYVLTLTLSLSLSLSLSLTLTPTLTATLTWVGELRASRVALAPALARQHGASLGRAARAARLPAVG